MEALGSRPATFLLSFPLTALLPPSIFPLRAALPPMGIPLLPEVIRVPS